MKKLLFLTFFLGTLILPSVGLADTSKKLAWAGTYEAKSGGVTTTVCFEGLVPCGKEVYVGGSVVNGKCSGAYVTTTACQFCHFFVMLDAILDFIFNISIAIAALMLIVAGLLYIMAIMEFLPGGPKTLTQAKSIIGSVFIGLFIIFGAWVIINLFFQVIGVASWTKLGEGWFQINCDITL